MEGIYADEPKQKIHLLICLTTFNMDEFKRVYSNEDTAEIAIPYFGKILIMNIVQYGFVN